MAQSATTNIGFQNKFSTTLTSGITSTDTTIPLNALPNASEGFLVIEPDSATNWEVIYYTSKTGSAVVCTSAANGRGIDDSTAISHSQGAVVRMDSTAGMFEVLQNMTAVTPAFVGNHDGWVTLTETLTYASATTFTCSAALAAVLNVGDKIKLTQTTVKYFYVVGISGTTITVTGGTDYTLANAAITLPFYSKEVTPVGFPAAFSYTTTWAGVTAQFTSVNRFWVVGRVCTVQIKRSTNQTSNATTMTATLPITAATVASMTWQGVGNSTVDNSTNQAAAGLVEVSSGATTMSIYKDASGAAWTAALTKGSNPWVSYEI